MITITCDKCGKVLEKSHPDIHLVKMVNFSKQNLVTHQHEGEFVSLSNPDLCDSCISLVKDFMYIRAS